MNEDRINTLANRALDLEIEELGCDIGSSGLAAWGFVFRSLSPDELDLFEKMSSQELEEFLLCDHSNDGLWEKFQNTFQFYEEWVNDYLPEKLAEFSDKNMADSRIWAWCFERMPLTRADYEFLLSLKDFELAAFAMAESPDVVGDDSIWPEIMSDHPDYDMLDLEKRLGAAYSKCEAHMQKHGDEWMNRQ